MKISVIIPTFSHKKWILSTIDSVIAQTYKDFEIIIVDDGSTDGTAELLAPLVNNGTIKYLRQPNQGMAAARNAGIANATGEYIAFIDDDDLWPPDKLEWQSTYLDKNPQYPAVCGRVQICNSQQQVLLPIKQPTISFETLFKGNPILSPGQVLIRKTILASNKFDPSIWGADDYDLWFKITKQASIPYIDRIALKYTVHTENSSKNSVQMLRNTQTVLNRHCSEVPNTSTQITRKQIAITLANGAAHHLLTQLLPRSKSPKTLITLVQLTAFWLLHARFQNYKRIFKLLIGKEDPKQYFKVQA